MRIYQKMEFTGRSGRLHRELVKYVKTGEFRPPRRGEHYLSGALPTVYKAPNDLSIAFNIMEPYSKSRVENKILGLQQELCSTCNEYVQSRGFDRSMLLEALEGLTKEIEKL